MDTEMAETEVKEETPMQAEGEGEAGQGEFEEAVKTEEEIEQELKETQISISRYAPHTVPNWDLGGMRERWKWHVRIFPIDQEDCRNCILDAATKIAQESWYYVPKRKNGQGTAELCMVSDNEAVLVMARVVRMPFYHRYVTIELSRREQEGGETFSKVAESATVVFDSTKCEKIKNTASSRGSFKRRNLWVRYVSEDTSKEMLRVLFPLSQTAQIQTVDNLRIGAVETNSKTDVLIFMKSYLTVTINGQHVLALQNKEPNEEEGGEKEAKSELETSVTAVDQLEGAPIEVADRTELRKDDKMNTSRILKRTLHQQQKAVENRRKEQMAGKKGRGEPPAKRGGGWGDGRHDRRSGGGRFSGSGFGPGMGFGGRGGRGGYGPGMMDPQGMAAEMMMMQAQLNQTIQNQLMMMNPGGGGGYGGGRYGSGSSGGRRGGRGGGGGGRGRKGYGGGGGGW